MLASEHDRCVNVALLPYVCLLCGGGLVCTCVSRRAPGETIKSLLRLIDGRITGSLAGKKDEIGAS